MLRLVSVLLAGLFVCMSIFGTGDLRRGGLTQTAQATPPTQTAPVDTAEGRAEIAALMAAGAATSAPSDTLRTDFNPTDLTLASVAGAPAGAEPAAQGQTLDTTATATAEDISQFAPGGILTNEAGIDFDVVDPVASDDAALIVSPLAALVEPEPAPPVWTVTASRVNVRQGPSTRYAVVTKLTRGETPEVIEILDNGWAFIRIDGGQRGYMSADFLKKQDLQG